MVSQLNRELVIRHWGLPKAREVRDQFAEWFGRGEYKQLLEFSGLDELLCELRTGEIVGFSGSENEGASLLAAISSLVEGKKSDVPSLVYFTNAYGGKEFGELDPELQRFLRGVLDDQQRAHLRVRAGMRSKAFDEIIRQLAAGRLRAIEEVIEYFEAFIKSRDEIADLVSIVRMTPSVGPAISRSRNRLQ
jgi:hypothetical protein